MIKFKNSLMYVLCVILAVLSSLALTVGFYVTKKDAAKDLKSESSHYQTDNDNGTQNTTIINNQSYSTTKHTLSQETRETDAPLNIEYSYKVTIHEDSVAVFQYGKEMPYIKLYIDLKTIPKDDKDILKKGIYAKNKAELIRILEDYDS